MIVNASVHFAGLRRSRLLCALLSAIATLWATPASAQLVSGANTNLYANGAPLVGNDTCYDSTNHVYLGVVAHGYLFGAFISTSGGLAPNPATGALIGGFSIGRTSPGGAFAQYPRCAFSPDLNGGRGGFLVVWHQNDGNPNFIHAAVVAYPAGVIGSEQVISDGTQGGTNTVAGLGIDYSATSNRFLVAWTTLLWGIQGRFVDGSNGAPVGVVRQLVDAGGSRDPAVAWNSATDEFGLAYGAFSNTGAFVGFKRMRATDGVLSAPSSFGFTAGTFNPSIDVNTASHNYVLGWSIGGGSRGAQFDQNGNKIGADRLISSRIGTPTSFCLAFNPASGTFLATSEDAGGTIEAVGVELNADGAPMGAGGVVSSGARFGSYVPRVAARTDAKEWNISYTRNLNTLASQIMATGSTGVSGPPPPPPPPAAPAPLAMTAVSVSPTGVIAAGTRVTITAASTGGQSPVQYQFWRYSFTTKSWTVAQAWSTSAQHTWTPGAADGGWYKVQVWARSSGGSNWEAWKDSPEFRVATPAAQLLSFQVSPSATGPSGGAAPGNAVTVSATATAGATGTVEYQFWRLNTGTGRWSLDRPWSTNSSYVWMPATSDEGTHVFQVWVRDGAADWQDWASAELFVSNLRVTGFTVSSPTVADGGTTTFTATVTGNPTGQYEYKFWRYNVPTRRWVVLRDYAPSSTFSWVPISLDQGTNSIQVWVRSAGSSASYSAWSAVSVLVTAPR